MALACESQLVSKSQYEKTDPVPGAGAVPAPAAATDRPKPVRGLSTNASHTLKCVLPVANPPVTKRSARSRALMATSTPLNTSVCFP